MKDKYLMLSNAKLVIVEYIVKPTIRNPFSICKEFLDFKQLTNKPLQSRADWQLFSAQEI
jgi:hypothetical protein